MRLERVDFSVLAEQNRLAGEVVVNPYGLSFVQRNIDATLSKCTWIAYIDVDEFVVTRRNPGRTVRDELRESFAFADSVHGECVPPSPSARPSDGAAL